MPRTRTRLLKLSVACDRLGCVKRTFYRKWHTTFTDPRPPEERGGTIERKVYEDELSIAVEESNKGKAAVLNYRALMNRI